MTISAPSMSGAGASLRPQHSDDFKGAMRHLATGVSVVTAGAGEARRGLTVSAVNSVSVDPPVLLACVNRDAEACGLILSEGRFCVNILGYQDRAVAETFAGMTGLHGVEKFSPFSWEAMANGAPGLSNAIAAIGCDIEKVVDMHSHTVFFGRVTEVRLATEQAPLVHFNREFKAV